MCLAWDSREQKEKRKKIYTKAISDNDETQLLCGENNLFHITLSGLVSEKKLIPLAPTQYNMIFIIISSTA